MMTATQARISRLFLVPLLACVRNILPMLGIDVADSFQPQGEAMISSHSSEAREADPEAYEGCVMKRPLRTTLLSVS